jgi:hypothetical protein
MGQGIEDARRKVAAARLKFEREAAELMALELSSAPTAGCS